MLFTEEIYFKNELYFVLLREQDNLLIQEIEEHKAVWKSYAGDVEASYKVKEYRLYLEDLIVDKSLMKEQELLFDQEPTIEEETGNKVLKALGYPVGYTGGIVIARELIDTYSFEGESVEYPCYCYKYVYELVFEEGAISMSIDHSKAMMRIRMNIKRGFRNVNHAKDVRCIRKFLEKTFCRSYESNRKKRHRKLKLYKFKHRLRKQ